MNTDRFSPQPNHHSVVDPWELQRFLVELKDWEITGEHHMHKRLQFQSCQLALQWHTMAQALCQRHGRDCLFYLGNVGCGRIDADILNRITGHITRVDLALAMALNSLEKEVKCMA